MRQLSAESAVLPYFNLFHPLKSKLECNNSEVESGIGKQVESS